MTASKGFPAEDLLQMLLECLQVTLRLKDPCDLGGALSDLGSGGHVQSGQCYQSCNEACNCLDEPQEQDISTAT
jgi:hypothetical protein